MNKVKAFIKQHGPAFAAGIAAGLGLSCVAVIAEQRNKLIGFVAEKMGS